jgi:predicted RNase H-like HicB family nuclease
MIYSYHVYRTGSTFAAKCFDFPGLLATGATHDEALANINGMIEAALKAEKKPQVEQMTLFEMGEVTP